MEHLLVKSNQYIVGKSIFYFNILYFYSILIFLILIINNYY